MPVEFLARHLVKSGKKLLGKIKKKPVNYKKSWPPNTRNRQYLTGVKIKFP